jgi:hypothetical protein
LEGFQEGEDAKAHAIQSPIHRQEYVHAGTLVTGSRLRRRSSLRTIE